MKIKDIVIETDNGDTITMPVEEVEKYFAAIQRLKEATDPRAKERKAMEVVQTELERMMHENPRWHQQMSTNQQNAMLQDQMHRDKRAQYTAMMQATHPVVKMKPEDSVLKSISGPLGWGG